jgi:hypothetical protein
MGFDFCNRSLNIQESIKTPILEVGAHLGMWGFIPSLSHILSLLAWPAPSQALALVAIPRLRLRQL